MFKENGNVTNRVIHKYISRGRIEEKWKSHGTR